MKMNPVPVIAAWLLLSFAAAAQDSAKYRLSLKSGSFIPPKNISAGQVAEVNQRLNRSGGKAYLVIQFESIPTPEVRRQLQRGGIELLEYVPNNAYTAVVSGSLDASMLTGAKARAVVALRPEQKMKPSLAKGVYPPWAVKVKGTIDAWISFPKAFAAQTVMAGLQSLNFEILPGDYTAYRIIAVRVPTARLAELASLPYIDYVQPVPGEDEPINHNSRTNSRANILQSTVGAARNLRGQGVVIGIGDNNDPQTHIDFTNRLIGRAALTYVTPQGSRHGTHVTGTMAGGGIANELYTGYAPKATIITQSTSNIIANTDAYVTDHGMVITNNSYGNNVTDCSSFGEYDLYSRIIDLQAYSYPELQHVFAVGNSGFENCPVYPAGFHTALGGFQSSKNAINVGNTSNNGAIYYNSSRGPVNDGRIKPEVSALGDAVVSSVGPTASGYATAWGTSMASPAVSGGMALLYERYRQLHSGANPQSGLVKALVCNGATDLGNPGPDYTFGFGWLNLLRSVEMLENGRYFNASVAHAASNDHTISVPANTAELKVLLYWHDPAAGLLASQTLVNDLDLELRDPSNNLSLPFILDTVPANVNNNATTGVDRINNIEQAVISSPVAGDYTVTVNGTAVTENPAQEYFLVYDVIPVSTVITHPAGGEKFTPGQSITIQWDSYGNPANAFTVEYSTDNGSNWTTISSSVAANLRRLAWTVPAVNTEQALVRVTRNSTALISTSLPFTIVGIPTVSLSATQCEGYIALQWGAIAGATDYEVMLLQGDEMVSKGTTTATSYVLSGLSKDSVYWFAVRARVNGQPGRRSVAISRQPNSGTCAGAISDNDLKIDALVAPRSGRLLTSSALTAATTISVRVKNLDNAAVNNFNVKYSVDGGAFVSEAATNIGAGATYTHNFTATYDFSAVGTYQLRVVVENSSAADPVGKNDTLAVTIRQLPNNGITLVTGADFLDDLESADDSTYYRGQIGLSGADRYDFSSSSVYGRVRPFVNTGIAFSGTKALTLDADRFNGAGTADSMIATFNLAPHNGTPDDIRLDFHYKNHGQGPDNANKIWVRGTDSSPWIEVYDLYDNQLDPGLFRKTSSIELSDLLAANGQDFSSSFQVRFGQFGYILAADNDGGAGYTFDDIHLYKVDNDLQVLSIDTPVVASCGLNNAVPVRVTVRNSADTAISNIPVKFTVDGGATVTETIASIAGNTNVAYTFSVTADLSATGIHTLKAWVDYAGDSFRENDTVTVEIRNSPIISSFPYLQNFETDEGFWYSGGKNNSWEYGTPASDNINRAASGSKAWKTNLTGNYRDQQLSYLYSPCFDVTGLTNPTLSLSIALDIEDCGVSEFCDGAYMEYSADGVTWTRLGAAGQGTNWYNRSYTGNHVWSIQSYTRWHAATIALPTGLSQLRLRFVMSSDPFVNGEGIAVDDIHIYDNVFGIYEGPPYTGATVNQTVSGSGWVDFTDGGKLIASVNANSQNLGSTDARAYIDTGAVRYINGQYYHERNITIKPANRSLADSATVRFYFLDSEMENLINATGCAGCTKPAMAYELGVSKYNNPDTSRENGTLADNGAPGTWLFVLPADVTIVPFDKGYYAEFKVKDFSEFWLNDGNLTADRSLPVELLSFSARRHNNKDVRVEWRTATESDVDRFEVEVAKGNAEYERNRFTKIGEVASRGNSTTEQSYSFLDEEAGKTGTRYYRLKIQDIDGRFSYSPVRPVVFNGESGWVVYPNPSAGHFNLVFQANEGEVLQANLYDLNGKLVHQAKLQASGFVQKQAFDLRPDRFAPGLYLLQVSGGDRQRVFRIVKQ